mgnify:FL=1
MSTSAVRIAKSPARFGEGGTGSIIDFDRPFATAPAVPAERVKILRDGFEKMLSDAGFLLEAKKLVDWDGTSDLNGADLQQRINKTVSQPADVIKRIKEILKEAA